MPSAKQQPSNIKHGGGIRPNVWVHPVYIIYGHVHWSLRILVNSSGPIKRHNVVDFVTL